MSKTLLLVTTSSMLLFGCQSKAGTGALTGGALGVGIGAIAGGPEGAIIGGAAGAVAGGLIGAYLDEQDQQNLKDRSPRTYRRIDQGEKLNVNDIINLHKAHVSADKIITLIRKTDSHFVLNSYQVNKMHQQGVPEKVIDYMMHHT